MHFPCRDTGRAKMICSGRLPSVSVARRRQLTYRPTSADGRWLGPGGQRGAPSARSSSNIGF